MTVLEHTLRNDLGELAEAAREVRAHLARARVEEGIVHAVDLALEELVSNTIRYGYDDAREHRIHILVRVAENEVRVTIEDDARPFDPTSVRASARPASLLDAPAGGRGILMVRALIEDLRYRRAGAGNALELVLPRARGTGGPEGA